MENCVYKLKRVSYDFFRSLIDDRANAKCFHADKINSALVAKGQFESKSSFLQIYATDNSKHRRVVYNQIEGVEPKIILVKEDDYFNIVQALGGNVREDENYFSCKVEPEEYLPEAADKLTVAPLLSSFALLSGHDNLLLNFKFNTPQFLYLNDVFSVQLTAVPSLQKSASYHDVKEIYFKVVAVTLSDTDSSVTVSGFYVFKEHSELFCVPPISSAMPPKCSTKVCPLRKSCVMSTISPCISNHVEQLTRLMLPFTNIPKPDCPPFFLISGLSGCGKLEALKVAVDLIGYHTLIINCYEFYGIGVSAIEAKLDYVVEKALKIEACVIIYTDFELIGKEKSGTEDARLVNSFLQRMATLLNKRTSSYCPIIFGITDSKTEDIVPNIARAMVHTIEFGAVGSETSVKTIVWLAQQKQFEVDEVTILPLVNQLNGFVYADLILLVDHAIRFWVEKPYAKKELTLDHFSQALETMEAAYSDAIGAAKVPSVRWDDVGGLSELKEEIMLTLNMPLQRPGFRTSNLRRSGILFYGPPGTGKTLMAKAVATECSMSFLSVKGPELMNMYVGQSERNVREVFERGRAASPCILFFDELDSLAPNRGKSGDSGGVTDRVVSQLLAEMDGLESNRGLFVIAATNRPDLVDPALLRPGRFDKMFYLGPCADEVSKKSVLQALINKFELESDVNMDAVVSLMPSLVTGADVYSICSNAWMSAARRTIAQQQQGIDVKLPLRVSFHDFEEGVKSMVPSLTTEDLRYYEKLAVSASNK